MTDVTRKIHRRIDDLKGDLVDLTVELIRIPTTNPPGENYTECAEFVGNWLKKRGFEVEYIRGLDTPGDSDKFPRTNIVARLEGKRPGECVHFNSHIDVVEAGEGWTFDPFGGEIKDGKIYGRGSCDMKGGLATSMIAVEAFLVEVPDFAGAIEISGTVDEETGGYGGVAYLAEKGYFSKPRVDHVIIPEPLNKDRICLGHRGGWWGEIETHGRIAHGSMPFLGDSAILHMGAVMEEFNDKLYPLLADKKTEMPVVPDGAKQSTININSIHGGEAEGFDGLPAACVADSCRLIFDRRFLIEESMDEVKGEIVSILDGLQRNRDGFTYSIRNINEIYPTMTKKDAAVPRALASGIEAVLNTTPDYVISPGSYDQKHIARLGHMHNCVAYGPGILDLAHQPDEYIGIDDMVDSAKIMASALCELLSK
ncbi:MAG: succinyl-diaminopimelate desuccinylase [Hyphomicrobiales bacterium]|nr:MAG: succinyl-diaminopimelate desuccinylase [Hyphomicrobiales bacterium]